MALGPKSFELLVLFLGLCHCMKIAYGFSVQCIEKERQALLAIKQSVADDYGRLSSWGISEEDCCTWRGIRCSDRTGHIISLDLHAYYLRGKLSPSLLQLRHLRNLDLSYNFFEGSEFPNSNGSNTLSKLRYLNLCVAGLSYKLLYQLGNLSKLQFLDFSENDDYIYNVEWFYGLSSLRYLNLSWNNLNETQDWPQLLYKLHSLQDLRLSGCGLPPSLELTSSTYPSFFNFTSKIIHLDLYGNQLEGDIPEFLGNICTLKTLNLSDNFLSGFSPALYGCLENSLEILRLSSNLFHGPFILPYFERFSSLRELDLSNNGLNGSLSKSFKQPSKLVFLNLESNQLTGSLPNFSTLSSLERLYVGDNQLNGIVTESLRSLSQLETLDVSRNSLKGVVSQTHFENLTKLHYLDLSLNHLAFTFNSGWVPPFQLQYIFLSSCKLGPKFPKWLQTQKNMVMLDISGAGISDTKPADWLLDLPPSLYFLNISHNQMTGKLPNLSSLRFDVIEMFLSSNLFEGPLPFFPSSVTSLNLAKNKFSGSISPLCKNTALNFLDVSDNLLSGVVPQDCSVQWQSLTVLNLANNNFSGAIPRTFGSLSSLETMNLRNNSFSGDLPSLKNCSQLQFLDLSENKLFGNIPDWMGENLSLLVFLSMRANKFNGRIPANFCQLTKIRILDLSQNQLSGTIPSCLNNLTAMSEKGKSDDDIIEFLYLSSRTKSGYIGGNHIEKAWVAWKGKRYEYVRYLGLFRIIDLAENNLVGEIPDEITKLSELVVLNLSRNNLIGSVPKNVGQLKQIQSLDLSRNHLSGRIPNTMADLNFLSFLDLSYNNLSGRIPLSTQLQTMDPSAFLGNQALCGPPITRQCPEDHKKPPDQANIGGNGNGNGDEFSKWFYAGMGLGFFVGFWGVFGSLLLKQSWRHAYFRFLDHLKDSFYVTFMLRKTRVLRKLKW